MIFVLKALGYYTFFIISWIISFLPLRLLYCLSDFFCLLIVHFVKYRRTTIFSNLRNSFPEKTDEEIKKIARGYYKHFCDIFIEVIKLIHISDKEISRRVVFKNTELFDELYIKKKNIILVSGHYGNWTWMLRFPKYLKHKPTVIYKPLTNQYFDSFEKENREKYGAITIPIEKAYKTIMSFYNSGELFLTWFLTDQRPPKPLHFWVNFLNQDTPVFLGAERIAAKTNSSVVYMTMQKVKRGYYEVNFKLIAENASTFAPGEVTRLHTKELEKTIIARPEYWLWSHKRWKFRREI